MNEIQIDARGLECPQPVLMTREALGNPAAQVVRVRVDDSVQCENVAAMARNQGWVARIEQEDGSGIKLLLTRDTLNIIGLDPIPESATCGVPTRLVIQVASDRFGHGDDELGALLMRSFIKTLIEIVPRPTAIVLLNSGVKLTTEGADSVDDLLRLAHTGVDIINCGTCLDFFNLKDKLRVGRISNMFEIAGLLATADRVVKP